MLCGHKMLETHCTAGNERRQTSQTSLVFVWRLCSNKHTSIVMNMNVRTTHLHPITKRGRGRGPRMIMKLLELGKLYLDWQT